MLALGTLSTFRWIEVRLRVESYAILAVRFRREASMPEAQLRQLIAEHGCSLHNMSYRVNVELGHFEYRMVLRTMDPTNLRRLSETLGKNTAVLEYRLAPTSE